MNREQKQLLMACVASPEDDMPRRALADAIQEDGNAAERSLGEFISLQLRLDSLRAEGSIWPEIRITTKLKIKPDMPIAGVIDLPNKHWQADQEIERGSPVNIRFWAEDDHYLGKGTFLGPSSLAWSAFKYNGPHDPDEVNALWASETRHLVKHSQEWFADAKLHTGPMISTGRGFILFERGLPSKLVDWKVEDALSMAREWPVNRVWLQQSRPMTGLYTAKQNSHAYCLRFDDCRWHFMQEILLAAEYHRDSHGINMLTFEERILIGLLSLEAPNTRWEWSR